MRRWFRNPTNPGLGAAPAPRRQATRAARDAMECGGALCAVSSACLPAGNRWLRKWVERGRNFLSPRSPHVRNAQNRQHTAKSPTN